MESQGYVAVCAVDDVPSQMPYRAHLEGHKILVCRDGDAIYAVAEQCPHKNKSMRFGVIFDGQIICPHHQYRFDLDTGRCNKRCAPVQTYEVALGDEKVWVRLA